jgi:hypothetical protein
VPYADLTGYVAGFDVCTIPFLRTPLTEATNPVKLYEYLATESPSSPAACRARALRRRHRALRHGREFVAALERVVREPDGEAIVAKRRKSPSRIPGRSGTPL